MERTFALIKPEAVAAGNTGRIIARIEEDGFEIKALKMTCLTKCQAENFYEAHREKAFFDEIADNLSSGAVVAMVLEKENAIEDFRRLMGAANPAAAEDGTLRCLYGQSIEKNGVHGAENAESAAAETAFFFGRVEIAG